VRAFTVIVMYANQPDREAGTYSTRELAAGHAAALLADAVGQNGERPYGVGIQESDGDETARR
jgi:hypothetical protein